MIALGRKLDHPALISTPDAPLARVQACVGAPACAQAHAPTRGWPDGWRRRSGAGRASLSRAAPNIVRVAAKGPAWF
ncbi:hypothetical protein QWZ10_09395 [Paracoccus cavernae]|uniref:Uncharacterized protein n=1 Tax=Paracoccus cavernae TaxID=1571207 RepID=A0ABT8D5B2_9RHOB|nr:hypothetical protein [Paracoccus cavernae]